MKILGISCFYHDAAATLLIDGKIVAAAEEERFSRVKHDSGFPKNSIDFCLKKANLKTSDLNWVVFYEKPFLKFERITLSALSTVPYGRGMFVDAYKVWLREKLWIKSEIANHLKVSPDKVIFGSHHMSHAASVYLTSPFKSAAILTVDGVGEWTTTAWGVGRGSKIDMKKEIKFPHSLGLLYSVFTQFLGFSINEGEFKVMGLSP
ncbi:MAG: carbamoyltransferase N-terminal domain-containing protein, partial [Patescibacteria group bacterium]